MKEGIRLTCSDLFERKYKQMREIFIPLCKKSAERYQLNILRIITLIYHMYLEYKLYNLAYNNTPGFLYEHQFINETRGKWYYNHTFTKSLGTMSDCTYIFNKINY